MKTNTCIKNFWCLIFYFLIYSFIGFILETTFGLITKGVIESRQSFLFGPFCIIYGIGAILIIVFLSNYKDKILLLFSLSSLIGVVTEYSMSYFCESIFHFKWWDYSQMVLNINGRVCLYFAVIWGFLGIVLIKFVNPLINHIFSFFQLALSEKLLKTFLSLSFSLILIDAAISSIALKSFYSKITIDFDMDLKSSEYADIYVDNDLFKENNMLLVYPNLQIAGTKYNNTYVDSLYKNKKTYYFKIFSK